jgi:hypothetical protein
MIITDFTHYSSKYNELNKTNCTFKGNVSVDDDKDINDFCINVSLIVIQNNKICYDFSKEFYVINGVIFNASYNSKTITMHNYHLIDILDEINQS